MNKLCSRCRQPKLTTDFGPRGTGVDYYCKQCRKEYHREHYAKNRDKRITQIKASKVNARERICQYIIDYLLQHPCVDCGESDPIVLDFDHQGDKSFNISTWYRYQYSMETLNAEIAKCEVRCANCHRRRSAKQFGHLRYRLCKSD